MSSSPLKYNIFVDTQPMAQEMDKVSSHVNGVKNAVVAMQAAVIVAENRASNQVCENINQGFFMLIRSQISQKIAAKKSEVDSIIIELKTQAKSMAAIKTRMEKDFRMITNRYNNRFSSLNKALRNRIFELDKPIVTLVDKEIKHCNTRINRMIATIPVNQSESLTVSQQMAASHTRQNGKKTITSIKKFISEMEHQRAMTSRILLDRMLSTNEVLYFPVLIATCEDEITKNELINIHIPQTRNDSLAGRLIPSIKESVYKTLPGFYWEKINADKKELTTGYYHTLLSQSSLSPRIKEMMMQFYKQNDWQTFNKI